MGDSERTAERWFVLWGVSVGIEKGRARENLRAEHVEEYAVDGERLDAASQINHLLEATEVSVYFAWLSYDALWWEHHQKILPSDIL